MEADSDEHLFKISICKRIFKKDDLTVIHDRKSFTKTM